MNETTKGWTPEHPQANKDWSQANKPKADQTEATESENNKPKASAEEITENKHRRQYLKQFSLDKAILFHSKGDCNAAEIVETAKAFYAFVRT